MTLYAAWNNQYDIKQLGESLLILSPDRTIGLMALTDSFGSWSDDDEDEVSSYFALQGFVNVVAPILKDSDRRSREEYAALLSKGMLQANATTHFATRIRVAGGYNGAILTAVLVVDSTLYGVHVGTSRVYIEDMGRDLYQATRDHKFWQWKNKQVLYDGHVGGEPGREKFDTFQLQGRWDSVLLCSRSVWIDVAESELVSYWERPWAGSTTIPAGTDRRRLYAELNLQQLCDKLAAAAQKANDHPNRRRTDKILAFQRVPEDTTPVSPICHIPRFIKLPSSIEPLYSEVLTDRDNEKAIAMFSETFERICAHCARKGRYQEARLYRQWLTDLEK